MERVSRNIVAAAILLSVVMLFPKTGSSQKGSEILYAPGATTSKWGSIALIQSNLRIEVDGRFGLETKEAVQRVQSTLKMPATGLLDMQTWEALTNRKAPTIQERAEALTFTFEATDMDDWEWNYPYNSRDPSGATWGPFGLTVLHNEVQEIFLGLERRYPGVLKSSFQDLYPTVRQFMKKRGVQAKDYLRKKVYESPRNRLRWVASIHRLANNGNARNEYHKLGRIFFKNKFDTLHRAYPIQTELDYAFYWDLAIHTSGLTSVRQTRIQQELSDRPSLTPSERRAVIGKIFVETLGNSSQRRSRTQRNAVYILGNAIVHGREVDSRAYGLTERPVTYDP
jgi:hypothetical protein